MKKPLLFYVLAFLILVWLFPVWFFSFLPFVDFPQHLAISHILHNYNNPLTFDYSQFFSLRFFPRAHILHTLFLHWASYLMPLEIAGKVLVSLIVILLPVSIYQFIKALGGNQWFSLLSFFFIYNYSLMWGFIAYCLGIPVFFFTLTLLLKLNDKPKDSLKIYLGLALLLILAVLLHIYIYLLLLISFLINLCFFNKRNWKGAGLSLLFASISFVFFFLCFYPVWIKTKTSVLKNISIFLPTFASIQTRCLKFPNYLFSGRPFDKVIFWFIFGIFFILFFLRLLKAIKDRTFGLDRKSQAICFFTSVIILLYLCLPLHMGAISVIWPRLAIFMPLLLIGPLSKVRLRRLASLIALTIVMLGMLFASLLSGFHKFNIQAKPLRTLLQKTEKNKRLVQLYTYPGDSGFFFHSFVHFGCYYTIWKDGLCGFIFPQKDPWHIVEVRKKANLPFVNVFDAYNSIFPQGWENFDYFLVCGRPSLENEQWLQKSQLRLIGEKGIWRLYRK